MRRYSFWLVVGSTLLPSLAHGVTIEWAGGARNLDVNTATRCTLMVLPSPGETTLPPRWRLHWVGESRVEKPVQILSAPGPVETAPICEILAPDNDEDRLSRTSSVEFCGPGDGMPSASAAYVLLIDPTLEARFTVGPDFGALQDVVFENAEVTINGGSAAEFPPGLRTYRPVEDTLGLMRAGIVGRGLDRVRAALLVSATTGAPVDSLEILSQSENAMVIRRPADLPDDQVLVLSNGADEPVSALSVGSPAPDDFGFGPRMVPPYPYEAKDFAFLFHDGMYHLFYNKIDPISGPALSEIEFGHAVSSNLYNWTQLPPVMRVRPGKWDDAHVWAPSIVEKDGTFYMFYTGVSSNPSGPAEIQRIGVAISTDLMTWTRFDDPIYDCSSVPWSYCDYGSYEGSQFRDPFVMTDPEDPDRWLMYYVTRLNVAHEQQIVGVAESAALTGGWSDLTPLWCTDAFPNNFLGFTESPMLFQRLETWFLFVSTNSGHPIRYKIASSPIADSSSWSVQFRLFDIIGAGASSDVWIAPEFLRHAGKDYLAMVSRAAVTPGIEIREIHWSNMPTFSLSPPVVTAVEPGGPASRVRLARISPLDGRGGIDFRVDLVQSGRVRLELFDLGGRRVARVLDAWLPAGSATCRWDGRGAAGTAAESGVYFARLVANQETRTLRVPHVR